MVPCQELIFAGKCPFSRGRPSGQREQNTGLDDFMARHFGLSGERGCREGSPLILPPGVGAGSPGLDVRREQLAVPSPSIIWSSTASIMAECGDGSYQRKAHDSFARNISPFNDKIPF